MKVEKTQLGYELCTNDITVFMGGMNARLQDLAQHYANYELIRVKQIHSDAIVECLADTQDYTLIADSHFSKEKNKALCVITADCVPVFIYENDKGLISGIHAGWRGVAARVIPKTIETLVRHGADPAKLNVVIGPHIQKQSFEVGNDVRDQILLSLGSLNASEYKLYAESTSETKSLVDLNQVVKTQLLQHNVNLEKVYDLHIDTVTSADFHSHRRDKEKAGRQISFICRTV